MKYSRIIIIKKSSSTTGSLEVKPYPNLKNSLPFD